MIKKAREAGSSRNLSPFEFDVLKSLDTYWNAIPRDQRKDPAQDAAFDEKFALWLRESSAWVPLKVLIKANPDDLAAAGYPEAELKAFLTAYHGWNRPRTARPARSPEDTARAMLAELAEAGRGR